MAHSFSTPRNVNVNYGSGDGSGNLKGNIQSTINLVESGQNLKNEERNITQHEHGLTIEDFDKKLYINQKIENKGQSMLQDYSILGGKSRIGRLLDSAKSISIGVGTKGDGITSKSKSKFKVIISIAFRRI